MQRLHLQTNGKVRLIWTIILLNSCSCIHPQMECSASKVGSFNSSGAWPSSKIWSRCRSRGRTGSWVQWSAIRTSETWKELWCENRKSALTSLPLWTSRSMLHIYFWIFQILCDHFCFVKTNLKILKFI